MGRPDQTRPAAKLPDTSGVQEKDYIPAARLGVTKVNIDTDGRWCGAQSTAKTFRDKRATSIRARPASRSWRVRQIHHAQEPGPRLRRSLENVRVRTGDGQGLSYANLIAASMIRCSVASARENSAVKRPPERPGCDR